MNRVVKHQRATPSEAQVIQGHFAPLPRDESDEDEINLLEYWQIIRRRARAILGLGFVAALMGALVAFNKVPIYQAEIKLLVEPEIPRIIALNQLQNATNVGLFYQTQHEIIASRSIAEAVIDKLSLDQHPLFIGPPADSQESKQSKFWKNWIPEAWRGEPEEKHKPNKQEIRAGIISTLLANIKIKGESNSQIIKVSYESPDAMLSASIANAIADAYIEKGLEDKLVLNHKAAGWLTERLAGLREKLEKSEQTLQRFQEKEKLLDTKSHARITSGKLGGITEALIKAQAHRAEVEIRYRQVKDAEVSGKSYESLQAVLHNSFVQNLKEEQVKLERRVSELSERYGEKHPKMIAARTDLRESDKRLRLVVEKVIDSIRKEYEAAVANEKELMRLSQQTEKEARAHKAKQFELAKLEREVEANRQLYEMFLTRFKETSLTGNSDVTNITVIDPAAVPTGPIKPRKKRIILAFTMAGLFLGVILVFLLEILDKTFRTPEHIEEKLGLPVLGVLPMLTLDKDSVETPERYAFLNSESSFVEGLSAIRAGIMFANIDSPPKMILVTSSVANEGKTTLSSNLALTYSQTGKTLLIDGDLRRQQHSKNVLHKRTSHGFSDFAAGTAALKECLSKDPKIDNLFYMHSGTAAPKPLELLSSDRFINLLNDLKDQFDHIIIDSAPLLAVSDSLILSGLVDEVVLVVKADETTHAMAKESVKRLATAHVVPVGVVLQQADPKKMEYYGSHYYSYGYGYGYGHNEQ